MRFPSLALRPTFLLLVLVAACGGDDGPGLTGVSRMAMGNGGKTSITAHGVAIEIDRSVPFQCVSTISSNGSAMETTLLGHRFGVNGGVFHIGSTEFGAVAEGDRVRVSKDGVFVNDSRRAICRRRGRAYALPVLKFHLR